jgi:hypothetical protein
MAFPSFLEGIVTFIRGQAPGSSASSAFGLKDVNRILFLGIIMTAAFLGLNFISGMQNSQAPIDFSVKADTSVNPDNPLPRFKELAEYKAAAAKRNIFQPYEAKLAEKKATDMLGEELGIIAEKTQGLKLVGISWLNTPESASAMIEDTESGVTHFLRMGERINSVQVEQIFADSIIISYDDEEMEMRL